jgi:8-oxo-dGTP diphosphatase
MSQIQQEINQTFGNKLRIRVCGICFKENSILLIKHEPLGEKGYLWAPPGGGMEYNENAKECLRREMLEETGLVVEVKKLLFVHEYINSPLHALELFFLTEIIDGELIKGFDPEMPKEHQIIKEVAFIDLEEISKMDLKVLHGLFSKAKSKTEILQLQGYLNNPQ